MISFYVFIYVAVGFGFFLGDGLQYTFDTRDRFRVAMSGKEVFVFGMKRFVISLLFWPLGAWMKYV